MTMPENERWKVNLERFNIKTYKGENNPIYVTQDGSAVDILDKSDILNFHSDKDEEKYVLYADSSVSDLIRFFSCI